MEFSEVARGRRAVRKFQPRLVPDAEVEFLIDLARHAPSSLNGQPWHFVILKSAESKAALVEIKNKFCPSEKQAFPANFLLQAPIIILVCVEKCRSFGREVENSVLAASLIMLGAHSRGLGTVYMSAYMSDEPQLSAAIRKEFNIPDGFAPITVIPLGYPDETPQAKELRPVKEIIHFERF